MTLKKKLMLIFRNKNNFLAKTSDDSIDGYSFLPREIDIFFLSLYLHFFGSHL